MPPIFIIYMDTIMKKIIFPLGNDYLDNINIINNTSIGQFYFGVADEQLSGCSVSHHYSPTGAVKFADVLDLMSLISDKNKKISIAVNIHFYDKYLVKRIISMLKKLPLEFVDYLIIGNLEVYKEVKDAFPDIKCAASSLFGIKNIESAMFFGEMGFNKIIFPRNVELDEIAYICKNLDNSIEKEAFIFGGGCVYCEGTCSLPHVFVNHKSSPQFDICTSSPIPLCSFPAELDFKDNFRTIKHLDFGFRGCGLCYANILSEMGISSLKITGRTMSAKKKWNLIRNMERYFNLNPDKCKESNNYCLYEKVKYDF